MSTQDATDRRELLEGSLPLLILGTGIFRSRHGQAIARYPTTSEEELLAAAIGRILGAQAEGS